MNIIEGDWRLPITKPWRFFSVCKQIRKTIKQVQPDILHLHFVTNVLMCRLALRKDKTPRLFQVPGPLHLESSITSFAERCTATKADYWAGACKKTCSIYTDKGISPQRVHLAYYGVPHKEASQGVSKNILRSEYGIADDAVSVVIPNATVYMPFSDLVDLSAEIVRLEKEEGRLQGEIKRADGMLSNERFISKAPQAKIDEERAKLEKYRQMLEEVQARLAQLKK
jgi:valyl-tRNA synthetase